MREGFDRGVIRRGVLLGLMMMGVAVTSYVNTHRVWTSTDRIDRSRQLISAVRGGQIDTRRIQADHREYLITGFEDRVARYEASAAQLRSSVTHLAELTATDPEQQARALAAVREMEDGITGLDAVVKLRGAPGGYAAVVALARERGGKSFVDPLLTTLVEMEEVERTRLAEREGDSRAAYRRSVFYGAASDFVGLTAMTLFVLTLARSTRARTLDAGRLAEQRELLEATLSSIGDGVIATDAEGNVTFMNPVAVKLTGWPEPEARGESLVRVFRIVNESTHESVENPALRALKDGVIVGLANHTVLIAKGGTEVPIDDSAAPIHSRGAVTGAVLVFRDISERQRTENELRVSEERRRLALDGGELGSWHIDPAANTLTADERFRVITCGSTDPVSFEGTFAAIHPADRDRIRSRMEAAMRPAGPVSYAEEYRVVHPDGSVHWVFAKGRANFTGAARRLTSFDGTVADITDRKRIEEEARDARARLEATLSAGEVATWTWDIQADWVVADRNMAQLFGLSDAAAHGAPVEAYLRAIHPDDRARVEALIQQTLNNHELYEARYRVRRADGGYRTVVARGRAECAPDGTVLQLPGVVLDVTRQVQAEEELRASEDRLRFALRAARMGTWELDRETGQLVSSDLCKANYGRRPDEPFTYADFVAAMHEEDRPRWQEAVDDAVARGAEFVVEYRTWWPDCSEHWVQVRGTCTPGPAGTAGSISGVSYDVTDRKRAEEALQFLADASASLAELVDQESTLGRIAGLAVGGFADWCVVDMLDGAGNRKRLEVMRPEPVARGPAPSPEFTPEAGHDIPHVLFTGEPEVVADLDALDPATAPLGAARLERLRQRGVRSYMCVPLLSRGRVVGGLTFLRVSVAHRFGPEELRVAQELARRVATAIENATLYQILQEQDRRKDEFLATLAHELRNPLAPVRNGIQILQTVRPVDERTARTLGMMDRQLGHMVRMIDDLMDVARVSSGKVVLRKERIDLQAVVTSAVETSRHAIEAGGHEFALHLPPEPLQVEVDRTRLSQVISNLLNNASKYTPHGGRVELSAERDGAHALIRVTDTGIGIPADMLPKIFEMFTQVGSSLDRSQGGLGIGLTLVKRLVEMHGGTVAARSAGAGKGSEFTVRLPLALGSVDTTQSETGESNSAGRAKLAVLVVDDNRDAADSLGTLLELKGHEVRTAHDGPEALRTLETYRPNLIVLDIGLPGMSGYEVAKRIRKSEELQGVTLTALTGWGQEDDRRRTKEAGFDYHLVKPADPAEVGKILDLVSARI